VFICENDLDGQNVQLAYHIYFFFSQSFFFFVLIQKPGKMQLGICQGNQCDANWLDLQIDIIPGPLHSFKLLYMVLWNSWFWLVNSFLRSDIFV